MTAGAIIGPPLPGKIEGWTGIAHICSWIGDDEYYFELSISGNLWQKGMGANPFPHTLNPSALEPTTRDEFLEEMEQWVWKFHASSEMGVVMTKVVKNNQVILEPGGTSTDPVLTDAHMDNCFDGVFAGAPPTAGTNNLPDQQNYCMGRCDALMLNTR